MRVFRHQGDIDFQKKVQEQTWSAARIKGIAKDTKQIMLAKTQGHMIQIMPHPVPSVDRNKLHDKLVDASREEAPRQFVWCGQCCKYGSYYTELGKCEKWRRGDTAVEMLRRAGEVKIVEGSRGESANGFNPTRARVDKEDCEKWKDQYPERKEAIGRYYAMVCKAHAACLEATGISHDWKMIHVRARIDSQGFQASKIGNVRTKSSSVCKSPVHA